MYEFVSVPMTKRSNLIFITMYHVSLVKAAQCFFGLSDRQIVDEFDLQDKYWRVSPKQLVQTLEDVFFTPHKLSKYLPKMPQDKIQGFCQHLNARMVQSNPPTTFNAKVKSESKSEAKDLHLVGICGSMHHGKTTMSERMVKNHQYTEYTFAAPLKEGCRWLFGFSHDQVWTERKDQVDSQWGISPRYVLQQVGTDLFRNNLKILLPGIYCPTTLWVENFKRWVKGRTGRVVVSDVRFIDEAKCIRDCGGVVVQIKRPSLRLTETHTHTLTHALAHTLIHTSETEMKAIRADMEIENSGTLEELYEKIDAWVG